MVGTRGTSPRASKPDHDNDQGEETHGRRRWEMAGRDRLAGIASRDAGPPRRSERHFTAMLNADLVRDVADVKGLIGNRAAQIVDARAAARFEGGVPEPRAGLRSGHIPGSRNVPFASLLNPDGTLKG